MEGIVEGWVWHDPKCPFKEGRCYCADSDGEAPPHDKWVKRPTISAKEALAANEVTIQSLQAEIAALRERVDELEKAGRYIKPYLEWTIGPESPGYHPTMPSAVASFECALIGKEQS